jgi:ABC-type polysaccharide/polyol phosphate export permease
VVSHPAAAYNADVHCYFWKHRSITHRWFAAVSILEHFQMLIKLNPMTPIVETFRYAFLGVGTVQPLNLLYNIGFRLAIVALGAVMFNRVEAKFMDTV